MAKYRAKQKSILRLSGGGGLLRAVKGFDFLTIGLCLLATGYGLLLVWSASMVRERAATIVPGIPNEVIKMAGGALLGLVAAIVMSFVDYMLMLRFWYVIAAVCLLLMLWVAVAGVAVSKEREDAATWIQLPGGFFFQPSELLKIGFILSYTWHLHKVHENLNQLKNLFFLGVHALIPFLIVMFTGDLGSALVFLGITVGMLFLAGMKLRWFAALGALLVAAFPAIWVLVLNDFQRNRCYAVYFPKMLTEAQNRDILYQQNQAIASIGSGQIFGKGLFRHTVDVPVRESDTIFTVAGEDFGLVGCLLLVGLLALVIARLILVSHKTRNLRARLLCTGIALMIGIQALVNLGVCLKLLPVIGITLPFFSAGGSSNLTLYIALGLVLTVYRHQNEHEDTKSYFDYLLS